MISDTLGNSISSYFHFTYGFMQFAMTEYGYELDKAVPVLVNSIYFPSFFMQIAMTKYVYVDSKHRRLF